MRLRFVIPIVIVVGLLLALAVVCWDPQSQQIDLGPKAAARINRYLALGEFLEKQYGCHVSYSFQSTPNRDVDLMVAPLEAFTSSAFNPKDPRSHSSQALTGPSSYPHGITPPDQYRDGELLNELGIRNLNDQDAAPSKNPSVPSSPATPATLMSASGDRQGSITVEDESLDYVIPNRFDVKFQRPLWPPIAGQKSNIVTLLNLDMLDNEHIDKADNIAILDTLAFLLDLRRGTEVHILYGQFHASLWEWLIGPGRLIFAITLAVVLLVIWRCLPRQGPIFPDPTRGRRQLSEHLTASGKYWFANRDYNRLLAAGRENVLARLRRRLGPALDA